jgi:hypothetical protein
MEDFKMELYHHGIKGQRWGVRRFQNYDGSYTQAGVKRYNTAKGLSDTAEEAYKAGKLSKRALLAAKSNEKNAYKQLKKDYLADEGRKLRAKGQTITNNAIARQLASLGGVTSGLSALGRAKLEFDEQKKRERYYGNGDARKVNAWTAASAVSFGSMLAMNTIATDRIRKIRAYDTHSSRAATEGNKRVANILRSELGETVISELSKEDD